MLKLCSMLHVVCYRKEVILLDRADNIMFLLRHINYTIKTGIDAKFKSYDLTFSQSQLIFHIFRNNGCISQKELQEKLKVSHPTVVGLVQRLEKNGFVKTEKDENDKRNKIIYTTELTEQLHKELKKQHDENNKKLMKSFSKEEMIELERLLNKMNENITEQEMR